MTELPFTSQLIATFSAYVIKPIHMLLMLFVIWYLHKRKELDLKIIKHGVAIFLLGEVLCSFNYLFFNDVSIFLDWAHGFCMVLGLGIIALGVFSFLDTRVVFFSSGDKRCAFIRFCQNCEKLTQGQCGLKKLFIFFAFAFSAISLMPLISPLIHIRQEVSIFGSEVIFYYPKIQQVFDLRIYPIVAFILLVSSSFILSFSKNTPVERAKYPFAIGTGFFTFSAFRYILLYCYKNQMVWKIFWEEFTELLLILGILIFLVTFSEQIKRYKINESK